MNGSRRERLRRWIDNGSSSGSISPVRPDERHRRGRPDHYPCSKYPCSKRDRFSSTDEELPP
jgi:hypothetical protein